MSEDSNRSDTPHTEYRWPALWRRAKEHRIVQWTVGYVAVAYGIQHAVVLTGEAFEWPQAIQRISMLLLALGVPLAMTFAWYHGDAGNRRVSGGELGVMSVVLLGISFAFYLFVRPAEMPARAPAVQQSSLAGLAPVNGISLAVLPLLNLSGDAKEDFFSDGMTEELTSALAKIPSLRVVGRTSAFQFKGENKDLRAIGKALSATHLIEGSVRKDGNALRITAQLIKADDGTHLWTESYDRELKGVFAVQEEIAEAIASALRVPLGLKQGQSLVSNRNIDPESYQQYLRAAQLVNAVRTRQAASDAIALLQRVIARNPEYAPAWAWLADAYDTSFGLAPGVRSGAAGEVQRIADESFPIEEAAAQRAVQLDPNLARGYQMLGLLDVRRGKVLAAEQLYLKALALDPGEPETLSTYSNLLAGVGRLKEALVMKRRLLALDPLVPQWNANAAMHFWLNGQNDAAIGMVESLPEQFGTRAEFLAQIYASMGRYRDAADALQTIPDDHYVRGTVAEAVGLLRTAPKPAPSPQTLPPLGFLGFVYLHVGAPERTLEFYEAQAQAGDLIPVYYSRFWHPSYAPVRKTERFRKFVRAAGLVEYWRAKGWPPQCHPTTADDFACE